MGQLVDKRSEAEKKLTPKQKRLADFLLTSSGSVKEAAKAAGYATPEKGQANIRRVIKLPHVQQYIAEQTQQRIGLQALQALASVARLSTGAKSEYVMLQASQDLLDRAGYKPPDRQQLQVVGDFKVSIDLGD